MGEEHASSEAGVRSAKVALDTGGAITPGTETTLRFNVTDAADGDPVNPVLAHEKEMHLIVVSRDLGYFAHVHPERTGQVGEYQVKHTFPQAGDYILYDEFELAGKGDEYHRFDLKVGGGGSPAAQLTEDLTPKPIGDYTVSISPRGEVKAGAVASFVVAIEHDGQPVTDLEPYLGAASHVVVLDESAGRFAHVHAVAGNIPPGDHMEDMAEPPAQFGPELSFSHEFGEPGLYKVWSQFSHNGQVQTVSWVVAARSSR
jgi:Cu+-exporting ATPase